MKMQGRWAPTASLLSVHPGRSVVGRHVHRDDTRIGRAVGPSTHSRKWGKTWEPRRRSMDELLAEVLHEDLSVYRPSLQPCPVLLGPVSRFRNVVRRTARCERSPVEDPVADRTLIEQRASATGLVLQGSGHSARHAGSVDPLTWPFVATGTLLLAQARLN